MSDFHFYDNLEDAEARVAAIYMIEALGDTDSPPEWLQDFVDDTDMPDVRSILEGFPEIADAIDMDKFDDSKEQASEIMERWAITGRTGLIVKAEICVRHYRPGSTIFSSSWGHLRWRWFTVDDVDTIVPKVLQLASEQHQHSKLESGAA